MRFPSKTAKPRTAVYGYLADSLTAISRPTALTIADCQDYDRVLTTLRKDSP